MLQFRPLDPFARNRHHVPDLSASNLATRLRRAWIELVLRHHGLVLMLAAVATAFAVWQSSQLRLDSDLRELLPKDDLVVSRLSQIEDGFGALGSVDVVIRGGDKATRHAFVDAIGERLEGHEMLTEVDSALPTDFFVEHALYYLTDDDIDELESRIAAFQHRNLCKQSPDMCTTPPDEKAGEHLRSFIREKQASARSRAGFSEYYERDGIEAVVVFLRAVERSADLDFSRDITREMRAELEALLRSEGPWRGTNLSFNLVGPYVSKGTENRVVRLDIARSAPLGLLGVIAVLWWIFRSTRAVLILLIPLLAGVAWSMGATNLVLGRLNTMTSLMGTAILGMGIDAGIHLLARVRSERRAVEDDHTAIVAAFDALMGPLLVASCTTVGAFAAMMTSNFPAFREFGIIGGLGVALCLLSMLTVFPALLCVTRIPLGRGKANATRPRGTITRALMLRARPLAVVLALGSAACWWGVSALSEDGFEFDGRKLQSRIAYEATTTDRDLIREIFGKDVHPGIRLTPDLETARKLYNEATLGAAADLERGDGVINQVFSVFDLLPTVDIDERSERIEELTEDFTEETWQQLLDGGNGDASGLAKSDVDLLRKMAEAEPFTALDLPEGLLARVRTKDGQWGVFAYPNYDPGNIRNGILQLEQTAAYSADAEPYIGEATVFAAMYLLLQSEWPQMLALAAGIVVVLVLLQVRSAGWTLLTLLPLVFGTWWMLAVMGATGLKFTLLSVPVFPAILGIGVDHGVYLSTAIARSKTPQALIEAVSETSRAIGAATATTALAFGSFLIADSGSLRDIGRAAVIGVIAAAVAALLILPTVAALIRGRVGRSSPSR